MLWSAVGRAYLATCPVNERARILANLRQSTHPDDAAAADVQWVRQVLRQTRRQGYGLRAADYASPDQNEPGQLNAIAVPVLSKGRIIACLSLVWPNAVMREDQAVSLNLARLKLAADRIGNSLSAHGIDKPVWLLSGHRQ
jgi:IclR family mhp operon transcriptional activator